MTRRDVTLRPAVPSDAGALARLRYDFRAALDAPAEPVTSFLERCTAWLKARLASGERWRCWVAERDGLPIGMVWLQLIEKIPNPVNEPEWHGYISSLYVVPESRSAGLGSRLLAAALRECEVRRVDAVILWPTQQSRSLYERHGFARGADLLELRPVCSGRDQAAAPKA
jgi:ribosomal protein S18 acetylase RimI-like enzyme